MRLLSSRVDTVAASPCGPVVSAGSIDPTPETNAPALSEAGAQKGLLALKPSNKEPPLPAPQTFPQGL